MKLLILCCFITLSTANIFNLLPNLLGDDPYFCQYFCNDLLSYLRPRCFYCTDVPCPVSPFGTFKPFGATCKDTAPQGGSAGTSNSNATQSGSTETSNASGTQDNTGNTNTGSQNQTAAGTSGSSNTTGASADTTTTSPNTTPS